MNISHTYPCNYRTSMHPVYLSFYKLIVSGFMIFSVLFSSQIFSVETNSVEHLNTTQEQLLSSMQSTNDKKREEAAQQLQSMAKSNVLTEKATAELQTIINNTNASLYARTKAVIILHYMNPHPVPQDVIHEMKEQITSNQHKLTGLNLLNELLYQRLSSDSLYNIADKLMDAVERIIFTHSNESETVIRQATNILAHVIVQLFHLNLEMATKDASIKDVIDMLNNIKNGKEQSAQTRMAAEHMLQNIEKYRKKYNLTTDSKQCGKSFSQ